MGKGPKDPAVLIEEESVKKWYSSAEYTVTCPLYAMAWQGEQLVVGGGSPPGWGQGRPLGYVDVAWEKRAAPKYRYTGDAYIEMMSGIVSFKDKHLAVTALTKEINYTAFDNARRDWENLASYRDHVSAKAVAEEECEGRRVALSPSGRVAVCNGDDQSLHVVALVNDPSSPSGYKTRCAAILEGHTKSIGSIAIAPLAPPEGVVLKPGRAAPLLIASVSDDNTLRLWRSADYPAAPDDDGWVEQITAASGPTGIISLEQPPHFPHDNDPQKKFRLPVVRFSHKGTELHIIMSRGGGPCFLVSYSIRWTVTGTNASTGKKRYGLSCSTLASVELERTDAVTTFELTPCDEFLVFGTADDSHVGVASRNGDIIARLRNHHEGPINLVALKQVAPKKFLLATHGLGGVPKIKIEQIELREGMSAVDVLKVITGLVVAFVAVVYVLKAYVTGPELFDCLWDRVAGMVSGEGDTASANQLFTRPEPELPSWVYATLPKGASAQLQQIRFTDPVVLAGLVGVPAMAATLVCVLSAVDPLPLYALACFAAGAFLGDGVLELLPLASASLSGFQQVAAWYLVLLLVDALTRSPPPDPSLQNIVKFHRKKGQKFGLIFRDEPGMENQITRVLDGVCKEAGLKGGTTIVKINGVPVAADQVSSQLQGLQGDIALEVVQNSTSNVALALDPAYKPCVFAGLMQHAYLLLRFAAGSNGLAPVLCLHAVLYEVANMAVMLSCNVETVRVVVMRVLVAQVWCLPAVGFVDKTTAEFLAPWVTPAAAAASLYVALTHLLPSVLASDKYGAFGVFIQFGALVVGCFAHSALG